MASRFLVLNTDRLFIKLHSFVINEFYDSCTLYC